MEQRIPCTLPTFITELIELTRTGKKVTGDMTVTCPTCKGSGQVTVTGHIHDDSCWAHSSTDPDCGRTDFRWNRTCDICKGTKCLPLGKIESLLPGDALYENGSRRHS